MNAVLISIQPKWCKLIASGKKTLEVRKTRPKLETTFKVYIYCTTGTLKRITFGEYGDRQIELVPQSIIGEFVCDEIRDARECFIGPSCLTTEEWLKYTDGYKKPVWGWHISDLRIYEKPKKLGEFHFPPARYCEKGLCGGCPFDESPDVNGEYMYGCDWERPLQTPPQSWCYVEEIP
jgi:predicted transcriptional regulator